MRTHAWIAAIGCAALAPAPALAVVDGFVEDFASGTAGWSSQISNTNPGSGGVGGAGDGFLRLDLATPFAFGSAGRGPNYTGDYLAAGITAIELSLNDVDSDQEFEIHVAIGNPANFWQFNTPFVPPEESWGDFVVDLTDASGWTQLSGTDTLENALRSADRLLVRHDPAPFAAVGQMPDPIAGEMGIDRIRFVPGPSVIGMLGAASLGALRRRRARKEWQS